MFKTYKTYFSPSFRLKLQLSHQFKNCLILAFYGETIIDKNAPFTRNKSRPLLEIK